MNKIRWGVLGCAKIGIDYVIPAICQSENGELAAIASRDMAKARRTAEMFNIPKAYGCYEHLLEDESIDAVYIPLANHLHMEWTIRAANAGKHILCEKPLALSRDEAERMVNACQFNRVKLAEAFMYRYHPRYEKIKECIRSGEIGDLRGIHADFTINIASLQDNIRFESDKGGGVLYDIGCYIASAARWLLGKEPQAVAVKALFSPVYGNVDMMASGLMEFSGAADVTFQCGYWAEFRNSLEILGTHGRIHIPSAFLPWPGLDPNYYITAVGETRKIEQKTLDTYRIQVEKFVASVLNNEPTLFSSQDSILNMAVVDAFRHSASVNKRVALTN